VARALQSPSADQPRGASPDDDDAGHQCSARATARVAHIRAQIPLVPLTRRA
jgi:hypothetical protein